MKIQDTKTLVGLKDTDPKAESVGGVEWRRPGCKFIPTAYGPAGTRYQLMDKEDAGFYTK